MPTDCVREKEHTNRETYRLNIGLTGLSCFMVSAQYANANFFFYFRQLRFLEKKKRLLSGFPPIFMQMQFIIFFASLYHKNMIVFRTFFPIFHCPSQIWKISKVFELPDEIVLSSQAGNNEIHEVRPVLIEFSSRAP